jgi:hypothetical protein
MSRSSSASGPSDRVTGLPDQGAAGFDSNKHKTLFGCRGQGGNKSCENAGDLEVQVAAVKKPRVRFSLLAVFLLCLAGLYSMLNWDFFF